MGVEVQSCDPDVDVECDSCGKDIGDGKLFCADCAGRHDEENGSCSNCRHAFPRREMFEKLNGVLCHHCAFLYEAKLAGLLVEAKV